LVVFLMQESSQSVDTAVRVDDPLGVTTPLDLSAQNDAGISHQAVFPTPYQDILSQDTIHRHYPGTFGSSSRNSTRGGTESAEKPDPGVAGTSTSREQRRLENGGGRAGGGWNSSAAKEGVSPPAGTAFYRCRLCGYQDSRHDKTKYHVVREHLHLGPYGCAYCPRYMWGRRHVARHIAAVHPTMPVQIRRAFDEFETYLRENIRKIGGQPARFPAPPKKRASQSPLGSNTSITAPVS